MNFKIRVCEVSDIPALQELIPLSAHALQAEHYSHAMIEAALGPIFGVDVQLIRDGTYFVAEIGGQIVGCGGWSKRARPYGGSQGADSLLDPATDAARIRAFFVHPDFARQGIGTAIMETSETAAIRAGFRRIEMTATLTGESLYARFGYDVIERTLIPAGDEAMPVVKMAKSI